MRGVCVINETPVTLDLNVLAIKNWLYDESLLVLDKRIGWENEIPEIRDCSLFVKI